MSAPDLTLHSPGQAPWRAVSNNGTISKRATTDGHSEEVVELTEDVQLTRNASAAKFLYLTTSALSLYPDRQYVQTDEAVTIDTNTGRTTASSMSGDLAAGILRLAADAQQQVQTIVLPYQFK
jgi:lipopolysaccharide export system protein LptC